MMGTIVDYSRDFGEGNTSTFQNPNHTYYNVENNVVSLTVQNQYACWDSTSVLIPFKPPTLLFVPNAFTPDGSTYNNTFQPVGYGVETYQMQIFNRWGEIIFTSSELSFGWDGAYLGNLVEDGVYVWKIKAMGEDGTVFDKIGHVVVLK